MTPEGFDQLVQDGDLPGLNDQPWNYDGDLLTQT
jgi:hypothetical protein